MGGGYKKFSLAADGIAQGVHEVSFQLKTSDDADDGSIAYLWSESINVFPGMTTDTWLSSETDENGARKIDKKRIFSTFYVVGESPSSDWFKANPPPSGGTPDGSLSHPYKNIQDSIDRVIAINDGSMPFTIAVDGTVVQGEAPAGKGMADFSRLGKPLALTIRAVSESADGRAMLDANGMSCVVYASPASASGGTLNLTLKKLIITGGENEAEGGGIYLAQSAALTMTNCEITGCHSSTYGGAVYTLGNLMMTDCAISGNVATDSGGGIYAETGVATATNCEISRNEATLSGGGVYVYSNSTFTMNGGTIDGNTANSTSTGGGGIYVVANGTLSMSNCATISKNTSYCGGGIYAMGMVSLTDSNISENTATENGGGVYVKGKFTMIGGSISGNNARFGGGMYNNSDSPCEMNNVTIDNNTATVGGGGILNRTNVIFTMTDCDISGNEASGSIGGGIYACSGGTITAINCTINRNIAARSGGGVWSGNVLFTMNGGAISNNTANQTNSEGGGGIYNTGTLIITGGATISGNTSKYNGGGIYFESNDDAKTLTLAEGVTISGNTASNSGGGVYACCSESASNALIMEGGTISGNTARSGGGVRADCSFEMTGGEISENTATGAGGGVYLYGSGMKMTMRGNTTISKNAAGSSGGGIYAYTSTVFIMENGTISENEATGTTTGSGFGGGIYLAGGVSATISNATISNCTARGGAGIYFSASNAGGSLALNNSTITKNTATGAGGGVYAYSVALTMTDGEISDNTATSGGGVDIGSSSVIGTFTMSGNATISGNKATGTGSNGYGGGVYIFSNGTEFTMKDGTISRNTANRYGGGVYIYDYGNFTFEKGTISDNEAIERGGGVFIDGVMSGTIRSGVFTMTGGAVSGNTAVNGGGVFLNWYGVFNMNGGEISGNEASGTANTEGGGGVSVQYGGMFTMTGGLFNGNAANHGLGAFVLNTTSRPATFSIGGAAQFSEDDDIYLYRGSTYSLPTITVSGALTAESPVATITLSDAAYTTGVQILSAADGVTLTPDDCEKFAVTPQSDGTEWKVGLDADNNAGVLEEESYTFTVDVDGEPLIDIDEGGGYLKSGQTVTLSKVVDSQGRTPSGSLKVAFRDTGAIEFTPYYPSATATGNVSELPLSVTVPVMPPAGPHPLQVYLELTLDSGNVINKIVSVATYN